MSQRVCVREKAKRGQGCVRQPKDTEIKKGEFQIVKEGGYEKLAKGGWGEGHYIEMPNLSQLAGMPAISRIGDIPVPKMLPLATLPGVRPGVFKPQPGLNKTFSGVASVLAGSASQCFPGVIGAICGLKPTPP